MLTPTEFESFRVETEQALKYVSEKYGVDISAGNISYTPISFEMKLKVMKREVGGKSFEQAEFERVSFMYGFNKEDYGKKVILKGEEYTLFGFKSKARKNPVLMRNSRGQAYRFDAGVKKEF